MEKLIDAMGDLAVFGGRSMVSGMLVHPELRACYVEQVTRLSLAASISPDLVRATIADPVAVSMFPEIATIVDDVIKEFE